MISLLQRLVVVVVGGGVVNKTKNNIDDIFLTNRFYLRDKGDTSCEAALYYVAPSSQSPPYLL